LRRPACTRARALRAALAHVLGLALGLACTAARPQEPADAQGIWTPLSRALEPLGPLVLAADRIEWSICRGAKLQRVPGDARLAYGVQGSPGCVIDGRAVTHLLLVTRGACNAELTLFVSAAQWRANEPEAWGVVERGSCR